VTEVRFETPDHPYEAPPLAALRPCWHTLEQADEWPLRCGLPTFRHHIPRVDLAGIQPAEPRDGP